MNDPLTHTTDRNLTGTGFEQFYTGLRSKEGRLYTDAEVAGLPSISNTHPHYKEWCIRKNSCKALLSYIKQKENILSILEMGCGNGWLSAKLAGLADTTGLDINSIELNQANRVFGYLSNLSFINGSLETDRLKEERFDMILFASSIQYFPSLKQTITLAMERLTLLGEIHIMDSPFYRQHELEDARERTKAHFATLGSPEMSGHYHHHTLDELETFQFRILHHPHSWKNKLLIKKNPFYWISIKNRYS